MIEPQYEIILYVADQQRSRDFYSAILKKNPVLDVPGMTEFNLSKDLKLGLMQEIGIAKILSEKHHIRIRIRNSKMRAVYSNGPIS